MSTMKFRVVGAGGHAKVVIATLLAAGNEVLGVYDDDEAKIGSLVLGQPVIGKIEDLIASPRSAVILAIGDNAKRSEIARWLSCDWESVVHPAAFVDQSAVVEPGCFIAAGAVVQAEAKLGAHSIVNTLASIDHDCLLGGYCHIAPGGRLAGNVVLGAGVMIGLNAAVLPGRRIGDEAIVGAGAVVLDDLPAGATAVGVPARVIKRVFVDPF